MIKIVHWEEIVGHEFLEKFIKISKQLFYANKKGRYEEELKKISDEDLVTFRKKRSFMRHCGYEIKGKNYYDRGWFGFPVVEGENIKFRYSADDPSQGVEFIPLSAFLNIKHNLEQDYVENEYYQNVKPSTEVESVKHRLDVEGDKDFPYEASGGRQG